MGGDNFQSGAGEIVAFFAVVFAALFGVVVVACMVVALFAATVGWP